MKCMYLEITFRKTFLSKKPISTTCCLCTGWEFLCLFYVISFPNFTTQIQVYPHKHFHGINVIILPEGQAAFSFFNNLFIPAQLNREDRHKVFEHVKIHICQHHLEMDKYVHNYPALRTSAQLDESLHIISDHPLNSHQDNVTAD